MLPHYILCLIKGSIYLFFLYTCSFSLRFLASLDVILSCYTNYERLTIEVPEFGKATSKHLNDEEHGQFKNEEFEAFKRTILLL